MFHELEINITSDQPLLSPYLRKKLNPLQIDICVAKDVPFKTEPKFKPIFATCKFIDGRDFKTAEMPQASVCRFNQKHVFLVGKIDPVILKEMFATR